MRILFWQEDKLRPQYSGKRFNLFRVYWDKKTREWVETTKGKRWAFFHPETGRVVALRKDPSHYGRVIETPDISVKTALGTPTLGVVESEKEE